MKTYIQLGACAGDRDPRANFRDGFTEYVKSKNPDDVGLIILVEANPTNIPELIECWKDYKQARVYNAAIRTNDMPAGVYEFYYALEDAPHYQVSSFNKNHVLGHYPEGTIMTLLVPTLEIDAILSGAGPEIEMLAVDVESMDAKIIYNIQWEKYNIKNVSFEFTSILSDILVPLMNHLESKGYTFVGKGLDVGGEDFLYTKNKPNP